MGGRREIQTCKNFFAPRCIPLKHPRAACTTLPGSAEDPQSETGRNALTVIERAWLGVELNGFVPFALPSPAAQITGSGCTSLESKVVRTYAQYVNRVCLALDKLRRYREARSNVRWWSAPPSCASLDLRHSIDGPRGVNTSMMSKTKRGEGYLKSR